MESLDLTHYYTDECTPLLNILNSSDDDQQQLINKLSQNSNRAFGRFKNIDWYLPQRTLVEKWMYNEFTNLGGYPKTQHPMYFILGDSEYLRMCYGNKGKKITININNIQADEISFTMIDSLAMYVSEIDTKKLYTKEMLFEFLNNDFSIINKLDNEHKYIEAQIWKEHL